MKKVIKWEKLKSQSDIKWLVIYKLLKGESVFSQYILVTVMEMLIRQGNGNDEELEKALSVPLPALTGFLDGTTASEFLRWEGEFWGSKRVGWIREALGI